MNVNVCMTGLRGRGVDDGVEDSLLKTEERLDLTSSLAMSSLYGRWPIGDRPRERTPTDWELALRFNLAEAAGEGAAGGASGAGGETGATY